MSSNGNVFVLVRSWSNVSVEWRHTKAWRSMASESAQRPPRTDCYVLLSWFINRTLGDPLVVSLHETQEYDVLFLQVSFDV